MGPNTRQEAIIDIERDILDSLKKLSKYTTDMSSKKIQSMSYDVFDRKRATLPQFKKLCNRTIRAARDGQQLAPRRTKHDVYYRLFEEFLILLDMQNDLLLEIEESITAFTDLQEFRKKWHSTSIEHQFKPVKERTPTPAPTSLLTNLHDIFRTVDLTLSPSPYKAPTPSPKSSSGYSSSSSSSSESTTTTTVSRTTTVRHQWSDNDDFSTASSSPHPDYVY
jgi:hypothetical protein